MRFRNWLSSSLLLGCLVAVPCSVATAQPPGGQRGQGGPGGRGGFGMGMGAGLAGVLGMPTVQDHLKLDDTQKSELREAQESMREEQNKLREEMRNSAQGGDNQAGGRGRGGFGGMSEEMRTKMAEMAAKADSKIQDILDPTQFDRLLGIFAQQDAVRALNHKLIAERLVITEEQKGKMKTVEEESGEKLREMFTGGGGRPGPEMFEKMQAARKETEEKIVGVLTAEQKKKFDELKGEKFEFPQFGGPGGPGGPGGRGGRGGDRGPDRN